MKFESKYGVGEICIYNDEAAYRPNSPANTKQMPDVLVKIVCIAFDIDGSSNYTVEHIGNQFGMQRFSAGETLLTGDPDFDQETGLYAPEKLEF